MSGEFAGALRERVTLERPDPARDTLGGAVGGWLWQGAAWAAVSPASPGPPGEAGARAAMPRWTVTLRTRGDVMPGWRILWRARSLVVRAIADDGSGRMTIEAEEAR